MPKDFMPLYSAPGIKDESGWTFQVPREGIGENIRIDNHIEEIAAILRLANGLNPVSNITKKLADEGKDPELIETIISNLQTLRILSDSREQYKNFHVSTLNPTPFVRDLNHHELAKFTSHETFSPRKGRFFKIPVKSTEVGKISQARKSCRNFLAKPLHSTIVATCLDTAYAAKKRPIPSGGGLYPLRFFVIVRIGSRNLPAGYYQYNHLSGQFIQFQTDCDDEKLKYLFNDEDVVYNAPVIVVIAADLDRQPSKYANKGYVLTLLEAGHAAQNIHLTAQELSIASLEYGGFRNKQLAKELDLKEDEMPLITLVLGHPKEVDTKHTTRPSEVIAQLEQYIGPSKPIEYVKSLQFSPAVDALDSNKAIAKFNTAILGYEDEHSFGTGIAQSAEAAYIKAVAEAYERFMSGKFRFDVRASASELSESWLDPRRVKPWTDEQYARMPYLEKFDLTKPIEWIRGQQYNGSSILIPVDAVFYPLGQKLGRKIIIPADSSGVAAHTSFAEAGQRGLLELIERDALMRVWLTRKPPHHIDVKALPMHIQNRANFWKERNGIVEALDLSHDGVAIALVVIRSSTGSYPYMTSGAAASIDSFAVALDKACKEAESAYAAAYYKKEKFRAKQFVPEKVFTPSDHGAFYLYDHFKQEVEWLWSNKADSAYKLPLTTAYKKVADKYQPITIRLTHEKDFLQVVRVLCPQLIPINFGFGNEHYPHSSLGFLNPPTFNAPHFFA